MTEIFIVINFYLGITLLLLTQSKKLTFNYTGFNYFKISDFTAFTLKLLYLYKVKTFLKIFLLQNYKPNFIIKSKNKKADFTLVFLAISFTCTGRTNITVPFSFHQSLYNSQRITFQDFNRFTSY